MSSPTEAVYFQNHGYGPAVSAVEVLGPLYFAVICSNKESITLVIYSH